MSIKEDVGRLLRSTGGSLDEDQYQLAVGEGGGLPNGPGELSSVKHHLRTGSVNNHRFRDHPEVAVWRRKVAVTVVVGDWENVTAEVLDGLRRDDEAEAERELAAAQRKYEQLKRPS